MKAVKKLMLVVLTFILFTSMTGCYISEEVTGNQFGLQMRDGVSITNVVGPGRYTDNSFRAKIEIIDGQAKQLSWTDDSLYTSDKQEITFEVSVTYARSQDHAQMMWEKYNASARDDEALSSMVYARIPRVAKAVTSSRTLDSMLGREDLQDELFDQLSAELIEIGCTLLDVGVNNIEPDERYAEILSQKSAAMIEAELAKEKTKTAQEQLLQEEAQTEIAIEKARRDNLVAEEMAKVYAVSPEMLQIELAKIYAEALKESETIYLPSDTTLNMFNGATSVVPSQPVNQRQPVTQAAPPAAETAPTE